MSDILNRFQDVIAEKKKVDPSKKIKVGIIGTGWIAEAHVQGYKDMPDVEIVAAADLIPGKAKAFMEKMGLPHVRTYLSHKEMLDAEKLDAVSVCTYNATHAECAVYALEKGMNVMLEKPMCVTTEEAVNIIRAEKKSGKILSIGFQPRLDPNMQMIKKIVDSGELGKVYYIQTGGGRRRGIPTPYGTSFIEKNTGAIGAVGDIGSYSLDLVLKAIGYPKPLSVTGFTSSYFGTNPDYYKNSGHPEYAEKFEVDDFAAAFVRLEGGIVLDFRIAWAMNINTPGDTILLGTKGGLRVPSTDCWNGTFYEPMTIYKEVAGQQTEMKIPLIERSKNAPDIFFLKLRSFADAVKEGGTAPVPSSEILYNQAIIDGIVKSAKLGKEIQINIPEI